MDYIWHLLASALEYEATPAAPLPQILVFQDLSTELSTGAHLRPLAVLLDSPREPLSLC